MPPSDEKLMERLQSGDREALDELFAHCRSELSRFVEIRLDSRLRGRVDASDIVQDAHLAAFRRLDDYLEREPMPVRVWLYKTAYECLLKARRDHLAQRRTVDQEMPLPQSTLLVARQLLSGMHTPSQQLSQKETTEKIAECLSRLAETDYEILVMRNYEDRPYEEISHLLDIEPAAARKRYGRALLRLQAALSDAGLLESP